jgi:hypothetical protein
VPLSDEDMALLSLGSKRRVWPGNLAQLRQRLDSVNGDVWHDSWQRVCCQPGHPGHAQSLNLACLAGIQSFLVQYATPYVDL